MKAGQDSTDQPRPGPERGPQKPESRRDLKGPISQRGRLRLETQ